MNRQDVFSKIEEIFVDLLDDENFKLKEEDSMDSIEDWDSLMHITLIASVEEEFKIRLSNDDIVAAKTIKVLIDVILKELAKS